MMWKAVKMWMVVLAVTTMAGMDLRATASSDYGLGILNDIMTKDPTQVCLYVSCQEPVTPKTCPNNTLYMENTSQFGCCGACIAFKQNNELCTGNLDPMYGEGYTKDLRTPSVDFLESLYNVSENNILHSSWCDYGLKCSTIGLRKCEKDTRIQNCRSMFDHYLTDIMSSDYKPYRDDYRWQPVCSHDGKFDPKQCIGPRDKQRCVCVDPDGNRLFGSAFPEQEELFKTMNCKCSREAWEKRQAGQVAVTLHCQENGNYEPLQCEDGWCHCVEPATGELYGSRLPETAMHMLICYNKTLIGEMYNRRCDSELYAHAKLLEAMAESGVRGPETLVSCDQDGSYASKQCDQSICRCWNKYFSQSIAVPSGDDCQCAEDVKYYQEINAKITVSCKVNTGAYNEEQVQGSLKFCVDEDGIRSGPLVHNEKEYILQCFESEKCQETGFLDKENYCFVVCISGNEGKPCPDEAYPGYIPPEETVPRRFNFSGNI